MFRSGWLKADAHETAIAGPFRHRCVVGEADILASEESSLFLIRRTSDGTHYFGRTLRRGPESGLRLPPLPRYSAGGPFEPDAYFFGIVPGSAGELQDRQQYPGSRTGKVHCSVGAARRQVRSHEMGRRLLRTL